MISERMYETTINVEHPCKFVSSDSNIKVRLEETFVNKCYYGSLILEILSINKTSMCRIITSNHNAMGTINVCFTAKVLNYKKGDIIPDAKIEIKAGQVIATSKYATITIEKSANTKILISGQTIPVIVEDKVLYNVNSSTINVLASILVPQTKFPVYHISGKLDSKIYNTVSNLIDKINQQTDKLKTQESKHFSSLLNSNLKTKPVSKKGGAAKIENNINIIKLIDKSKVETIELEGYYQRDTSLGPDSLILNVNEKPPTNNEYINVTTVVGIQELLYDCYAIREGIINMGEFYDKENMEQASNIWTLMKKSKLL